MESFTPWPLCPRGKSPRNPLNGKLWRLQCVSEGFSCEENLLRQPGNELHFLEFPSLKAQVDRFHPVTGHEGPYGEQRCSSTLFLTSALERVRGQRHVPAAPYPLERPVTHWYRRLGEPQGRPGQGRKISPPPGFDPWKIQPVGSPYTDYATRSVLIKSIPIYKYKNRRRHSLERTS